MPSPQRRPKERAEFPSLHDKLLLSIGHRTPELVAKWFRYGAEMLRSEFGRKLDIPLRELGPPDGWTAQDQAERQARCAELEAGWKRRRQMNAEEHKET